MHGVITERLVTTCYPIKRNYNDNCKTLFTVDPFYEASFYITNELFENKEKKMYQLGECLIIDQNS